LGRTKPQPQFVAITWEDAGKEGPPVTVRAVLCLRHRKEVALEHPSARGSGRLGEACDLCEGRRPRSQQPGACPYDRRYREHRSRAPM
jgi:hypothetical protein